MHPFPKATRSSSPDRLFFRSSENIKVQSGITTEQRSLRNHKATAVDNDVVISSIIESDESVSSEKEQPKIVKRRTSYFSVNSVDIVLRDHTTGSRSILPYYKLLMTGFNRTVHVLG